MNGFSETAKAIGAHVVSVAHNDQLTVKADAAVEGVLPAVGIMNQSDVADGGVIAFSAPASSEAAGTRYACTGYTLTEIEKTAGGSVTNVTEGNADSFNYTTAGKEVLVTWHFSADYKVTTAAVNDSDAVVTVTSGTGYVTDDTSVTLTASTTSETREFQYWYGDVPYEKRYQNPLTITGGKPLAVNAFFGNKAENAATILATSGDNSTAKSWFASATWTGGVVPGTNDTAVVRWTGTSNTANNRFKVDAASFFAVKNLEISNACVRVNATVAPESSSFNGTSIGDAADKTRTEPVGCDIYGNLTIDSANPSWNNSRNGGYLLVGGRYQLGASKVVVMGDLTIANGALRICAGYPFTLDWIDAGKAVDGPSGFIPFSDQRTFFRGENALRVLGKTTLKIPTIAYADHRNIIHTVNEFRTGAAVWLDFQDVEVQEKAGFTAYSGGYGKFDSTGNASGNAYSMCPGGHCRGDNTSGGSYGGAGGSESSVYPNMAPTTHMATYGFENAPYYPGAHNGGDGGLSRPGAGSIRLDCKTLDLEGGLFANGMGASGNKGGSSGGGIWVICEEFNPGANCAVEAKGGNASGANSGGGGGRVAICEGISAEQVEELFSSADHTATDVSISPLADKLTTRFSVAGGTGTSQRSNGYDGTGVYIVNTAGKKEMTVMGAPENFGAPEPAYGPHVFEQNEVITLAGPEDAYVTDDELSKRQCVGYTITDMEDNVLVDSDDRTGSYTITTDCKLVWKLTTLVHRIETGVTVGGSITTNAIAFADEDWQTDGSTVTMTAVPASGFAFAGWYGELPTNLQGNAVLSFTHTKGRSYKAMFVTTAAGEAVWTGEGDGQNWDDAANWSIGAIPGANSEVTIPEGADVKANFCVPVSVKRLTVASGATLTFGPNGSYSTYSKPRIADNAKETDWQRVKLTVAGDLVVNGTFSIGGKFSLAKFDLAVGGSLLFGENAKGNFYAAFNAPQKFLDSPYSRYDTNQVDMALAAQYVDSCRVTVGGLLGVATNAVVSPWCDFYSGASVRFDIGSLNLAAGGKIDADGKGWGYTSYSDVTYSLCPTLRDGPTNGYAGGTHAGVGGYADMHSPSFKVYGWRYAPILPGGPGFNTYLASGGGVVRIHAKGMLRCYGSITAIGASSGGYCGAGGGVFLTGTMLRTGDTTVLSASGRDETDNANHGAGAGGRLVIGTHLQTDDLEQLFATGACDRLANGHVTVVDLMSVSSGLKGTITARGGVNNRTAIAGRRYSGEDGTACWLKGPIGFRILVK